MLFRAAGGINSGCCSPGEYHTAVARIDAAIVSEIPVSDLHPLTVFRMQTAYVEVTRLMNQAYTFFDGSSLCSDALSSHSVFSASHTLTSTLSRRSYPFYPVDSELCAG